MRSEVVGASSMRDIHPNIPDVSRPANFTSAAAAAEKVCRLIQAVSNINAN
jgi:hypothetical protein